MKRVALLALAVSVPVNRHGGDRTSRYNWRQDSSNAAAEGFFMGGNGEAAPSPAKMIASIVRRNRLSRVKSVVTVPIGPYVTRTSRRHCSYPVSLYGEQERTNPDEHPEGDTCGNGRTKSGEPIALADPMRTHYRNTTELAGSLVRELRERFGVAASGGVAIYELDNEPGRWMETHRDVQPRPVGYHELAQRMIDYAWAIKDADGTALVLGPSDVVWDDCWKCAEDGAQANGGTPLGRFLLERLAEAERARRVRLLDYLSFHDPGEQAGDPVVHAVANIRKWRQWVDEVYPGTMIAVDEYTWSSDTRSTKEGLLVAEGLWAFGREGVALASYWPSIDWNADATTPAALAFRLYRNYDGQLSVFGDVSVRADNPDESRLAVFAAQRMGDGVVTVVAVNKSSGEIAPRLQVDGVPAGAVAAAYRLSEANPGGIARVDDVALADGTVTLRLPPASATLLAFPTR